MTMVAALGETPTTTPPVTSQRVVFTQNSKVWYKDGSRQTEMDVAPTLLNARICLPLRYVAYALGIDEINWDNSSKQATIKSNK